MKSLTTAVTTLALGALLAGAAQAQNQNPTISIQDANVTEQNGGAGIINFTVFLSKKATRAISLQIQTSDQTAVSQGNGNGPFDYAPSGLQGFTFSAGDSAKQFSVTFFGDGMDEDNETFRVFLSNPSNATLGDAEAIGTIVDDDNPPSITIANATAPEGDGAGNMSFPVTLSAASGKQVSVTFAAEQLTGASAAVVAANCGGNTDVQSTTGTITFPAGQRTANAVIPICGNATAEPNETFRVRLSNAVNATLGTTTTATGTLLNDDAPNVSIASRTFAEGDPVLVGGKQPVSTSQNTSTPVSRQFTISLSAPTTQVVTVNWELQSGTATGGAECRQSTTASGFELPPQFNVPLKDFIAMTGQTVTFNPGQTSATFTIQTCRDFKTEDNEQFQLSITNATNANIVNNPATCTLTNDD